MLLFGALEAGLTPLLSALAEEALAVTVPLGYLAQALAVIAPFLMIGAAVRASENGFGAALPFFFIYLGVRVLMQFPLAIYEYSASLTKSYLFVLFVFAAILCRDDVAVFDQLTKAVQKPREDPGHKGAN
jgi:hypothetical protein